MFPDQSAYLKIKKSILFYISLTIVMYTQISMIDEKMILHIQSSRSWAFNWVKKLNFKNKTFMLSLIYLQTHLSEIQQFCL